MELEAAGHVTSDGNRNEDAVQAQINPADGPAGGRYEGDELVMPDGTRYAVHVDVDLDDDDDPYDGLYDLGGDLDEYEVARRHTPRQPSLKRPADSAAKAAWVDYCVALGADRAVIEGTSEHWDGNAYAPTEALTRNELVDLAGRLGG
jgi:hypothetical protein